ncbi:MAG: TraR/DksA C4-type zinc finger protein [Holosporales bacterium]|jgi:DnaK suppressor protein|nr:TraR/DksA C4-type zinc finger protein [Holosporales bacterium]
MAKERICKLPKGYIPSKEEVFMNDLQQEYFRQRLLSLKEKLLSEFEEDYEELRNREDAKVDIADQAFCENEIIFELRVHDRACNLIRKIDRALSRLELGVYGYCEETGDPIELERLITRPTATLCIKAQEKREREKRSYSEEGFARLRNFS